ncbi:uncharacterized protein LY79DRAFT_388688 [Colletotrichum navitas]|uniref:DUF6594 domain-containing protein n=1 Tax=Colletotrichum navitas TaxID=681940 RepID=A0AAD8V7U6_9PEZI|nr:uncharacterized protein LY79DRAFT_388688 [Colletotrichum navitas]KAK1597512.1 hypothetical protein LY79DRAFT_388688 [Colletotrichum navitas]
MPAQGSEGSFAGVSAWLSQDPDSETFIFRKFNDLSARNILYLQCELLELEEKLKRIDEKVWPNGSIELKDAARTWEELLDQAKRPNSMASEMMTAVTEVREKLKEYHEALVLQKQIAAMHRPRNGALEATRYWLDGGLVPRAGKKPKPKLGGKAKGYLDDGDDLVSLKAPVERDYLSEAVRTYWPGRHDSPSEGRYGIRRHEEQSVTMAVGIISTILAAILLIGAIVGFSYVTAWGAKLGMICAFTTVFALSVGIMTSAKRAEIFAATAAYAAVLVVFVSNGDLSGSQCCPTPGQ